MELQDHQLQAHTINLFQTTRQIIDMVTEITFNSRKGEIYKKRKTKYLKSYVRQQTIQDHNLFNRLNENQL